MTKPKYAIISEFDAPQPNMVCEWVKGVGYCYLDRSRGKPRFDGMPGDEATSLEAFGIKWVEHRDGRTTFSPNGQASTAQYRDGEPREWQSRVTTFEHKRWKYQGGVS